MGPGCGLSQFLCCLEWMVIESGWSNWNDAWRLKNFRVREDMNEVKVIMIYCFWLQITCESMFVKKYYLGYLLFVKLNISC